MINIALFGLGRIGFMHGKNLMRNKDFNLHYVYDLNKKLTLDTGHMLFANGDSKKILENYKTRLKHIHCKIGRASCRERV